MEPIFAWLQQQLPVVVPAVVVPGDLSPGLVIDRQGRRCPTADGLEGDAQHPQQLAFGVEAQVDVDRVDDEAVARFVVGDSRYRVGGDADRDGALPQGGERTGRRLEDGLVGGVRSSCRTSARCQTDW